MPTKAFPKVLYQFTVLPTHRYTATFVERQPCTAIYRSSRVVVYNRVVDIVLDSPSTAYLYSTSQGWALFSWGGH